MEKIETNYYRTDEKRYEMDEMREALTYIAVEIEKYDVPGKVSIIASKTFDENKVKFNDVNYKSKLKCKRKLIAKLRKDLKAAWWLAKTLSSVKKKETTALTSQLVYARGECVDLLERYNNNIDIIGNLHKQNASLQEKLENLARFINLGYVELQKIQCERIDEPTTLAQLKKLIESCGQYYADYRNEIEISQQIKQRNRFLKNKIIILENNIGAIKEQLKALEFRCHRLKTENNINKAKNVVPQCLNVKVAYSEIKNKKQRIKEHDISTDEKRYQNSGDSVQEQGKDFDLSTHLEIVKRLLSDQDTLLKDLSIISQEISIV